MRLETLILIGGILHFGLLIAGALVPRVLDWKHALGKLDGLSRQIIWTHGAFIVLIIIAFGLVSVFMPDELAAGSPLARALCGFIAAFWGIRLAIQLTTFDARAHLSNLFLKTGYHGLTFVFLYHTVIYGLVAFASRQAVH